MLIHGDALTELRKLDSNSVHLCVTDPPYHLDKMSISGWDTDQLNKTTKGQQIKSLPGGMKFSPDQGKELYAQFLPICQEIHRVMKPGGFFFSFSSPRLYHRMTCAMEDVGFHIRDCFAWLYTQTQAKAMSVTRFDPSIPPEWKTPQVKSCFEPIAVAQKPPEGPLYENFVKYGVGLFNTDQKIGAEMFPANCLSCDEINETVDRYFLVPKPTKAEKGHENFHKTVKPIAICEHLIRLASQEGQTVLDCFMGSGTTGMAAGQLNREFMGIEVNGEYFKIAECRVQ